MNVVASHMKGNPPRLPDGRLKPLNGHTKLQTIEDNYQRNFFPGLPNRPEGIITLADARRYYSDAVGRPVIGVKEIRRMAVHDFLPHIPQSNYITQIALFALKQA